MYLEKRPDAIVVVQGKGLVRDDIGGRQSDAKDEVARLDQPVILKIKSRNFSVEIQFRHTNRNFHRVKLKISDVKNDYVESNDGTAAEERSFSMVEALRVPKTS